jgi:acyl-coenzyme A thioesterase PaaI-like protein
MIGRTVKYVGTSGVKCLELTTKRSVFIIKNNAKVRNHIGGVHAAAMALVAETATGMLIGMNIPVDKIGVIKSLKVDYLKRVEGDLTAVATLTDDQIQQIITTEKGDTEVQVTITDSANKEPIEATMIWAWIPKVRKPNK